jgi:hypothetical protein
VVRAELDLSREIEHDISVLSQRFQLLVQPVKVLVKVLHAVQHAPVRTEPVRVHDILEGDQGRDVDRARVWDVVVCRVKVHDGYRSVERSEELVFAVAVGRFPTAWRTDDDFAKRHFGRIVKEITGCFPRSIRTNTSRFRSSDRDLTENDLGSGVLTQVMLYVVVIAPKNRILSFPRAHSGFVEQIRLRSEVGRGLNQTERFGYLR